MHRFSSNVSWFYVLTNKQIKIPSIEESLRHHIIQSTEIGSVQVLIEKHIVPSISTMKISFL